MNIQIWNAYASNNSGAYTIVASFESPEKAAEVAKVLLPVLQAEAKWHESAGQAAARGEPKPLQVFARQEQVAIDEGYDWPEYGEDNTPRVVAVSNQVLLHHPYTVSLPRFFGHWFYAKGGRVDSELDHTHHRLVVILDVWWPYDSKEPGTPEERGRIVRDRLLDDGGPVAEYVDPEVAPVWQSGDGFGHAPLRLIACLTDLVAGVAAISRFAERFAARVQVRIIEAVNDGDPLAGFRGL
jgi:hypothetical protein